MQDGGHDRSPCPTGGAGQAGRGLVMCCCLAAASTQPVHKKTVDGTKSPLPSTTLLEQYQRFTRLSTTTSDPDSDLVIDCTRAESRTPDRTLPGYDANHRCGDLPDEAPAHRGCRAPADAQCPRPAGGAILLLLFWFSRTLDDWSASPWKVLGKTIRDGQLSTAANGKAAGQSPHAHNCQRTSTMGDRFRFNV